jgi:hypothetical protein
MALDDGGPSAEAIVAAALLRECELHASGRFDEIGEAWDDVYGEILPLMDRPTPTVALAFNFWDGWVDACNHDWHNYPGIERQDWPVFARELADALTHGTEVEDPTLLRHFRPRQRRSLRARVSRLSSTRGDRPS